MFTKIKQLFSDSFAFAFATLGNKMVSFLLLPILTRFLAPGAFGDWDVTNTLTMLLSYVCILGTDAAFAYYFFDVKNEEDRKSYFSATVYYSTGVALLFLIMATLFSRFFSSVIYDKASSSTLIVLAFIATVEAIFIQHSLALARYKRRVWLFNSLSMTYWIGSAVLNVLFVMNGFGVEGLFWGQVIAGGITSVILFFIFRDHFTFQIQKSHLMDLLKYGIPIVPSLLSFWVMNSYSRLLIYHLVSKADAGIFGAAVRFASFIALVTSAFQLAWRPFAMSIKEREDAPQIFSIIARGLLVVGTLAILVLTFFIKSIMIVVATEKFYTSYSVVWMLSLGTLLNTLYVIFSVGLLITKKTKVISQAFTLGTIFYLICVTILVPLYGYWGTAGTTVVTYLFIIYFVYFRGRKYYPIPFKMGSVTAYIMIYLSVMVAITYFQLINSAYLWSYNILGAVVVIFSVFATKLISFRSLLSLRKKYPVILAGFKKSS